MRRTGALAALLALAGCMTTPSPAPAAYAPPEGVAYAWVTFDARGQTGQGALGMADRGAARALTVDDPVRVASISKLVTTLVVMRLVEKGLLDLDEDVSVRLGWTLRNPAFPDRPITLRMLLSHTSSLTDQADYIVPLGETVEAWVKRPGVFDSAHAPGGYFRYTNLNFPLVAQVMERAMGERFDRLMRREVLAPLGLSACYNWSGCSDAALGRAVILYERDGTILRDDLRGKAPDCLVAVAEGAACDLSAYRPGTNGALFSPQGGLRASAADLAVIGRLLLNRGRHGGAAFLTPRSIATIEAAQWTLDGPNGKSSGEYDGETWDGYFCAYGLAVHRLGHKRPGCHDDLFAGRQFLGHSGDAYRVRSGLWVDPATGTGIAYFATNNGEDPPKGDRTAFRRVEEFLAGKLRR